MLIIVKGLMGLKPPTFALTGQTAWVDLNLYGITDELKMQTNVNRAICKSKLIVSQMALSL